MTIFDFISGILFSKKKDLLKTVDEESEFSPFLVNRWLSMYSPQIAILCNDLNKYLGIFENKKELYSLFLNTFPKQPYKKIQYFKRIKQEQEENYDILSKIAITKELSLREITSYFNMLNNKNG